MRFLPSAVFLFLAALPALCSPDAADILANARLNPLGSEISLDAQLRAGSTKVPFTIEVKQGRVAYIFESPREEILLRFGNDHARIERSKGGPPEPVPDKAELVVNAGNLSTVASNALRSVALVALKSALARTLLANVVYETRS